MQSSGERKARVGPAALLAFSGEIVPVEDLIQPEAPGHRSQKAEHDLDRGTRYRVHVRLSGRIMTEVRPRGQPIRILGNEVEGGQHHRRMVGMCRKPRIADEQQRSRNPLVTTFRGVIGHAAECMAR